MGCSCWIWSRRMDTVLRRVSNRDPKPTCSKFIAFSLFFLSFLSPVEGIFIFCLLHFALLVILLSTSHLISPPLILYDILYHPHRRLIPVCEIIDHFPEPCSSRKHVYIPGEFPHTECKNILQIVQKRNLQCNVSAQDYKKTRKISQIRGSCESVMRHSD